MTADAGADGPSSEHPAPTGLIVQNKPLMVLTVMAAFVFLRWAQEVFIPITLAVLLSYALTPSVAWLHRRLGLHRAIGAGLLLAAIFAACGVGLSALQPQAVNLVDIIPPATQKMSRALRPASRGDKGALAKIEQAAKEIDRVANSAAAAAPADKAPEPPPFRIRDYILVGTVGLVSGAAQFVVVVALVYFLLIAGDTFRRTLLATIDEPLSRKKETLEMLDEIDGQIQRYLIVQIATSALLGVVAWATFISVGFDNALAWACIGTVLHLIPYAGPAAFVAIIALMTYVQFDSLQPVVETALVLTATMSIIALLVVPWLTHKTASVNAVTVFVALLVWGWLWGVWGLLLGVPIVMAIQTVCDHVEGLQPIAAFLGNTPARRAAENARDG
jgi:predicted PurR-regulated permease PerM